MRVVVEGNLSPGGSYAMVNLHLAEQLARRGHRVAVVGYDLARDALVNVVASRADVGLEVGEPGEDVDVRIRQVWPPVWGRRGAERLVVIQPWEFGSIPVSWLAGVRDADAIWVPSEYCKRSYLQAGVAAAKVWVVPNGVELDALTYHGSEPAPRGADEPTRLLFLGGTIARKGVDVLVAALDELDDATLGRVELTVKDVGAESYYVNQSLLGDALTGHPRVASRTRVESRYLARAELLDLIASADALVHPYRSEGFGLGVLEAMAVGTTVLHTRGGATNEFCGANESLLIPSTLAVGETARVGELILADRSYWYEPSVSDLVGTLAGVISGEIDVAPLVRAARERAQSWSWERAGEIAGDALDALLGDRAPDDELSKLTIDLAESLRNSFGGAAGVLARLAAVGDVTSAFSLARLVESRREVRARGELSSLRERLAQLSESTADVWSGGPYRSLIASAQHQRTGFFANAHDFEGGDAATYDIAQRLSGYLGGCESILDVACGQGSMMRVCRAQGKRVQGIEADPALVRELRADGFTVHEGFVPGDLASLHPEPFDGVFVGHIVEHLSPSECQELLGWIFEHVADHGTIVIQTPDFATSAVGLENFWLDATHVRPYPVRLLKAMLMAAGFVPVEGACGPVRDVAPLDVIAVARRVARTTAHPPATLRRDSESLQVAHVALLSGTSGFAHASRSLFDAERLASGGVDLVSVDVATQRDEESPGDAVALRALGDVAFDVAVVDLPLGWISAVSARVRASYRVARTTFEATPVPYDLRRALREFDEVWCFSRYDERILTDSGVDPSKVHVVAPGVEPLEAASVAAARARTRRDRFRFLSVFSFEPRKNPEALLRAFAAVATTRDCELVLKLNGATPPEVESWLQRTLAPSQRDAVRARVKILTQRVSRESLSQLYFDTDVFVLPTRGEGYGLPFLEAMAHGLATICPDVGGHRDFCTGANSLLVATSIASAGSVVGSGIFRESLWREVDHDDLVRAMTIALDDRARLATLARRALFDAAAVSLESYHESSDARLRALSAQRRPLATLGV